MEDNPSCWSGDHILDPDLTPGIILSNARLRGDSCRGIDVAPTLLAGLGLDRPGYMTGKNLL